MMSDKKQKLTKCEHAMWERLHEEVHILWGHINGNETQTLNRLVKKGVAEVHAQDEGKSTHNTYWQLLNEGDTCK